MKNLWVSGVSRALGIRQDLDPRSSPPPTPPTPAWFMVHVYAIVVLSFVFFVVCLECCAMSLLNNSFAQSLFGSIPSLGLGMPRNLYDGIPRSEDGNGPDSSSARSLQSERAELRNSIAAHNRQQKRQQRERDQRLAIACKRRRR